MGIDIIVSIVVSVYNIEEYLNKCLSSFLPLRRPDLEILLIDDGSTDSSSLICKEYAESLNYMSYYRKKNEGLSSTRNFGIKASKGIFIIFIDGDDFVDAKGLDNVISELLSRKQYPPDICGNNIFVYSDETHIIKTSQCKRGDRLIEYISNYGNIWNTWRYVFSRSFLMENALWFKNGLLCEDVDHTARALLNCRTWLSFDTPYYYYRKGRVGSIMNAQNNLRFISLHSITTERAASSQGNAKIRKLLKRKLLFEFILSLSYLYEFKGEARLEFKRSANKTSKELRLNLLPINFVSFFLLILRHLKKKIKERR